MTGKYHSELFISLLSNELEVERSIRQSRLAARSKAIAERFRQYAFADGRNAVSVDPPDCVQMMTEKPQSPWII